MLTFFRIERTFYNTSVSITVDVKLGEASLILKRDRRILVCQEMTLRMHPGLRTPEGCNKYLSDLVDVPGGKLGRLEAWHAYPPRRAA